MAILNGFRIEAIPPSDLMRIREAGVDDFCNALRTSVVEKRGAPLRCCLREADAGERVALMAFRPYGTDGPYTEVGPVFIHAEPCRGYATPFAYPEGYRSRRQVFRPYDSAGNMVYDAFELVEGVQAEQAIARILARTDVAVIHSRNVLAGCYMFAVHRQVKGE